MMFSRFAAFYGHVWRSQFKNDGFLDFSKKERSDRLASFSDEILNQVILHCREFCAMPPTLPQVIGLCKQINKRHEFYKADPNYVPANSAVVTLNLAKCRNILIKGNTSC